MGERFGNLPIGSVGIDVLSEYRELETVSGYVSE